MDAQRSSDCTISAYDASTKQTTTVTEDAGEDAWPRKLCRRHGGGEVAPHPHRRVPLGQLQGPLHRLRHVDEPDRGSRHEWVFSKTGTSQYADVKSAVLDRGPSLASLLPAKTKVKIAAGRLNGKSVHVLSWTTTDSQSKVVHIVPRHRGEGSFAPRPADRPHREEPREGAVQQVGRRHPRARADRHRRTRELGIPSPGRRRDEFIGVSGVAARSGHHPDGVSLPTFRLNGDAPDGTGSNRQAQSVELSVAPRSGAEIDESAGASS